MRFLRPALLILTCFLALPLSAAAHDAYYVSPEELPPQLLPAPPAEGSPAWKKQIDAVIAAQQHISKEDLAALHDEQHMRLELMTDLLGSDFSRAQFPATYALLEHVLADTSAITEADKNFWHTERPYLEDKRIKLLVGPLDNSPSYPSGHTSDTRVLAEVMGTLYPERLEEFRRYAGQIAHHRVEAGVHYPADLEAGRLLAMLITGALMKSEAFKNDLAAARAESAH